MSSTSSVEGHSIESSAHPVDLETSTGIAVPQVSIPSTDSSYAGLLKRALHAELRASKAENDLLLFASENPATNALMCQLNAALTTNQQLHAELVSLRVEKENAEKREQDSASELARVKRQLNNAMVFARNALTKYPDLHPRHAAATRTTEPTGAPEPTGTPEPTGAPEITGAPEPTRTPEEVSPIVPPETRATQAKLARQARSQILKTKRSTAASRAKPVDKDAFFWENAPINPRFLKRVRFDLPLEELPQVPSPVQRIVAI